MKAIKRTLALLLTLLCLVSGAVNAFAATVSDATINPSRTASLEIYKYDLTNAEKDGVWDSSYVSTGVKDAANVNSKLGNNSRVSDLGNGDVAYGYALKGVEFTYLRVADIRTYTESERGISHVELLYGIPVNTTTDKLLNAIGVTHENRYAAADQTVAGKLTYYYQSDTLIDGLAAALANDSTTVKNALENYVRSNGGTTMPETDSYGHTAASGLPLGLYLVVETAVPEMVTTTTAPFFVSLPMTSINGSNASDGGDRWIYDVCLYPKNLTGIPTLEKTVREAHADTGSNGGSLTDITDGYAHTATASDHDAVDYQITSTLPAITSEASYLTEYTFVDTLSPGISFNKNDVVIEFFTDASCTNRIATWKQNDGTAKFKAVYGSGENGASTMTISMTAEGLREINGSKLVYTRSAAVNSGYSDCTMRITYSAAVNSDASVMYGDNGNTSSVMLTWRRSSTSDYDSLYDDCHVCTYGIDLIKQFSDNNGDFSAVSFILHNDTDNYYVKAERKDGYYYVTGHAANEADATKFVPTDAGNILIRGLEDDTYTASEITTDNGYTLLRDDIVIDITSGESETLCDWYDRDTLGTVQNDERYAHIQKHLQHYLLTASATVDGNAVDMRDDDGSINAFVPLTVINTRGFDLPRTGSTGNWMYPVIGVLVMLAAAGTITLVIRSRKKAH